MQRINGNKVNGKEAHFNAAEAKQLEAALHDLGNKLLAIAFWRLLFLLTTQESMPDLMQAGAKRRELAFNHKQETIKTR